MFVLGLFDNLPINDTLHILHQYLPRPLYNNLKKYVTTEPKNIRSHLKWTRFQQALENLNLESCASKILKLLENPSVSENNVKTFHIDDNHKTFCKKEPNQKNTLQMIYNFLNYIYQRNIVASLVKYIVLKPLLKLLENSNLMTHYKGIFSLIYHRLKEIIFECVLFSFNGSNYDNYLLCNYLIIIQSKRNEKIKIFKKGSALSTIHLICKKNFTIYDAVINNKKTKKDAHPTEKRIQKEKAKEKKEKMKRAGNQWLMSLFIKDLRNLVAANLSLDKLGKLFSLNVSKLCFPYEYATSVKKIKETVSLHPYNENMWKDSFFGRTVLLEDRLNAQTIYNSKKFSNLYEYGNYYLVLDCVLLHSILLKMFNTYLNEDNINIFVRRNYSQSNLSYQQFFIIEPSKQIKQIMAPIQITNKFYNYFIKQAVTGGLCTSFVHGNINNETIINEHLNYLNNPNLDKKTWPNFNNLKTWNKIFNEKPSGITIFDIRSLYPSAAVKKIPVGIPLFYSRFVPKDFNKIQDKSYLTLNINSFCNTVENEGHTNNDFFKLVSIPPRFYNEFHAINYYLQKLPLNIKILRFQTNFTGLGQCYFQDYPVDAFLSFVHNDHIFVKIIQYQSTFYHGHSDQCTILNNPEQKIKADQTVQTKINIKTMCDDFQKAFSKFLNPVSFEYIEISDCDFFLHQIPKIKDFHLSYKKNYTYDHFLKAIYSKTLTGFLVVKDLEIKKNNQNPLFGFIIQKTTYNQKNLSPYSQQLLAHFAETKRVISLHKSKSFMVISTEYFNWLNNTFGFENIPNIYHALFFKQDHYLKDSIEYKLQLRQNLKKQIKTESNLQTKQNLEIRAELIKLMLNSCYGYTLCNLNSNKFKHFENRTKNTSKNIISCIEIDKNCFLIEKKKNKIENFQTLLGHVGCSILFYSKIILLKRLYFLLHYFNPTKAQLLYMDTDSAHFLFKHPHNIVENVDSNLQQSFNFYFNKHFETGNKISGIWVTEGTFENAEYLGEKSYHLFNTSDAKYLTHMKGLKTSFQQCFHEKKIDIKENPFISYNIFFKSPDFVLFKTHMSKDLFSNFLPIKRYFVSALGSLPLKLD